MNNKRMRKSGMGGMKPSKRLWKLLCCITLAALVLVFVGCGLLLVETQQPDDGTPPTTEPPPTTPVEPPTPPPVVSPPPTEPPIMPPPTTEPPAPPPAELQSDLYPHSLSLSSESLEPGQSLRISLQLGNAGNGEAPASTVRLYRSENRNFSSDDAIVGTVASGAVGAGENSGVISADISTTLVPGIYYYGACVDSVDKESNTRNNCTRGALLRLGSSDDHSNSSANASVLAANGVLNGSIETAGDQDWFSITLSEGGSLALYTSGTNNEECEPFARLLGRCAGLDGTDTFGALFDSDGFQLFEDYSGGVNLHFRIDNIYLSAGSYYLRVSEEGNNGIGNYTIHAEFTASSSSAELRTSNRADTQALSIGASANGSIETAGEQEWFSISLAEAGNLLLYSSDDRAESDIQFPAEAVLFDSSASEVAADYGNGPFLIRQGLSAGTYYLRVNARSGTGDYSVHALFSTMPTRTHSGDHGDTRAEASALATEDSVTANIATMDDEDWFIIVLAEAGRLVLYSTGRTNTSAELYDSSDTTLATNAYGGSGVNFFIEQNLSAGRYYLKISGNFPSSIGDYSVHSHFVPNSGI